MKILMIVFIFLTTLNAQTVKEVLLLHSYNKGLKWSDGISKGVEELFQKYPQFEIVTEYMDSKKINTKSYFDALLALYKEKFTTRHYEVVIAADNYALEFVLKYHTRLFGGVPIVFCGLENYNQDTLPFESRKFVTGVVEYKEIDKNLHLIKKMIPDIDTVYIIADNTLSSQAIKAQIFKSIKKYEDQFNIIYDNSIQLLSIQNKLNALPKPSAILFVSLYKDSEDKYVNYQEIRDFFLSSKYPVFALNTIHLGEGVLGGIMIDPYDHGTQAAQKALEIVNGKAPAMIEITTPSAYSYFDDQVLKKFSFQETILPKSSHVINRPKDFFQKNRQLIDSLFLLMPLLLLLILFLIFTMFKKMVSDRKLAEQNKLDKVLLNNIKSAILWESKDGFLLGCNDALCHMLAQEREDIISRHMNDIFPELNQKVQAYDDFVDEFETILYHIPLAPMDVLIRRKKYLNNKNEEAGIVTLIGDVTQLKTLEMKIKKDEQFIIQRSKLSEIGEMMTSIAHQWKTPLVEISAIAQGLQYQRKKRQISQEETDVFVDDIMVQVGYMTHTIDDFKNFIKPSTSKSEFSVNKAIGELLHVIEHNIKYNYIEIDIVYENNQAYYMFGYPNEFKQCILNVVNNAKESIITRRDIDKNVKGKISLAVHSIHDEIYIDIYDNGVGIDEANLENIFKPFVTTKKEGDGFGLYMVKLIIEDKMGGSIKAIKSENGALISICINNELNRVE